MWRWTVLLLVLAQSCRAREVREDRFDDGALRRSGELVDGLQEGEWSFYYASGRLRARGSYRGDVPDGEWTYWYEDGTKEMHGTYRNERQHGDWSVWYPNGRLEARGRYEEGLEVGPWTYWHATGQEQREGSYLAGERVLRWTSRDEEGRKRSEGAYLDDVPVGAWRFWDETGRCSTCEYATPEGCTPVLETWPDGTPRREGWLRSGTPDGLFVTRHPDGSVRLYGTFRDGLPAGTWSAFLPDGRLLARGALDGGRPVGIWSLPTAEGGSRRDVGDAPRPSRPWSGEWDEGTGEGEPPDVVLERWLAEVRSPMEPPPPRLVREADEAAPPAAEASVATERPEMRVHPPPFTVKEESELEDYARYYATGRLPRGRALGTGYAKRSRSRRPGRGDRELAASLLGRELPMTRFLTAEGRVVDLADFHGKKILFVILRGFTSEVCVYCATQTKELGPFYSFFREANTEVFVMYPGTRAKLTAFLEAYQQTFDEAPPPYTLLYDTDLSLAGELSILARLARPTSLILDENGIVRYAYVAESDENIADRPPAQELVEALEEL